jgi:hypothetical protein
MRSVFVHLVDATRESVSARLSEFAEPVGDDEWRFPRASSSPVLYIGFYEDLEIESEPEDIESLRASLGQMPSVIVAADISGRVPGDVEARQFVEYLLRLFRGAAWDDYTRHCWTLEELLSGAQVSGHRFFDYDGWYRETHEANKRMQ